MTRNSLLGTGCPTSSEACQAASSEIVLIQVGDGLGVVGFELGLGDLIHPGAHDLPEDLPPGLPSHRLGNDPDGVLRLDEAQWHGRSGLTGVYGAA